MHRSLVYTIDAVLVVGTLVLVAWAFLYATPVLASPENGFTTTGAVLFSFEKGDFLLIDDNAQFTSPERIPVNDQALISLSPGTYYWKVEGALSSEIRQVTVQSAVELKVRKSGNGYDITNGGNDDLSVDVYDKGILTGNIILSPDESNSVTGSKFVGRQAK